MYICIYVCIYIYTYVGMYICIYIYSTFLGVVVALFRFICMHCARLYTKTHMHRSCRVHEPVSEHSTVGGVRGHGTI